MKTLKVPHQLLSVLVLTGFAAWVLAPLVIPKMAANAGMSHDTLASLLRLTVTVLHVAFVLVMLRVLFSPVHAARGDQPPSQIVASNFASAPLRRDAGSPIARRRRPTGGYFTRALVAVTSSSSVPTQPFANESAVRHSLLSSPSMS